MRSDEQVRNAECEVRNGEGDEQVRNAECEVRNDEQAQGMEKEEIKNEENSANGAFSTDFLNSSFLSIHSQGGGEQMRNAECEVRSDESDEQMRNAECEERNDEQRSLASLEAELAKEREARALCESRLLCIGLLDEAGLPRELGDYLATSDADETEKRVKCVAQIIKEAVNGAVRARLEAMKPPARGRGELTKKEFRELSLADMQRLYVTDRELYRRLTDTSN